MGYLDDYTERCAYAAVAADFGTPTEKRAVNYWSLAPKRLCLSVLVRAAVLLFCCMRWLVVLLQLANARSDRFVVIVSLVWVRGWCGVQLLCWSWWRVMCTLAAMAARLMARPGLRLW